MRIKDLKSKLNTEMEALVPDVFKNAKAVPIVNALLPFGTPEQQFRQKLVMRMLFATCCAFFSVLIITAAFLIGNFVKGPTPASMTYFTLYVAPSVGDDIAPEDYNAFDLNFAVDQNERVLLVSVIGDDNGILDGVNFRFVHIKTLVSTIINKAWDEGLFSAGDLTIATVAALNDDEGVADQMSRDVSNRIKVFLTEKSREYRVSESTAPKSGLTAWASIVNSSAHNDMAIDELISILNTWYINNN